MAKYAQATIVFTFDMDKVSKQAAQITLDAWAKVIWAHPEWCGGTGVNIEQFEEAPFADMKWDDRWDELQEGK